jgi:hypothetical protein
MKVFREAPLAPDTFALASRIALGILVVLVAMPFPVAKDKLKPEQLIASHLDSIASKEVRESVETLVAAGEAAAIPRRGGSGSVEGMGRVISSAESGKFVIAMDFQQPSYPHERIGFDGEEAFVAQTAPGARSPLGQVLHPQSRPMTEGLLGGVLTTQWALLHAAELKPKLKYKGLKKADGEKYHVLEYKPRESSDFKINLFFEQETFRHLRTEYKLMVSAGMVRLGTGNSPGQEKRITMVEVFSEFGEEGGLTLPHSYKIELTLEQNTTLMIDWVMSFQEFQLNQPVDSSVFGIPQ